MIANARVGLQVAYIPGHANGELAHPDVEYGFITSIDGQRIFCRYWHKGQAGVLRTTTCSECTLIEDLVEVTSVPQSMVEEELIRLGYRAPLDAEEKR